MLESPLAKALYVGNGVTTEFPFAFKVWEPTQIEVVVQDADGKYGVVTGWTVELTDTGGTVTYRQDGEPLPEGWKLAIVRKMDFVQLVDLITGTRWDPAVIEKALDVATAERQELRELISRAIVYSAMEENVKTAEDYIEVISEYYEQAKASEGRAEQAADSAERFRDEAIEAVGQTVEDIKSYRDDAQVAATQAQNYASVAIQKADAIKDLTAEANTLPYPSVATAEYSNEMGRLFLGIPEGKPGEKGQDGKDGLDGRNGDDGPPPAHMWDGTSLSFQNPDGTWGQAVNLKGEVGPQGQAPSIDVIDCGGACDFKLTQIDAGMACSFAN